MKLFGANKQPEVNADFSYLDSKFIYLDSACQTLRPQQVIDATANYFHEYNACGGRVKYEWGTKVDEKIVETRRRVLSFLDKSDSEYVVVFTLNTSYGINLVLSQLPAKYIKLVTSDIEHNSVFLPTIEAAKKLNIPRQVLSRSADGALEYVANDLKKAVVVLNSMSNIDGRVLQNLDQVVRDVHEAGGVVLVDAAQGISHSRDLLRNSDYDALFFAGHKFYAPSLGIIVIKKSFLLELDIRFVGGGMVDEVDRDHYKLVTADADLPARLEIGLQNFAGIIGLNESIKWQENFKPEGIDNVSHQLALSEFLFKSLADVPTLRLLNKTSSSIVSFYSEKIDSHKLAIYLSAQNIMVRSGYFCCHYFLKNVKNYPPLVRVSLGLHNTMEDMDKFTKILKAIIANL